MEKRSCCLGWEPVAAMLAVDVVYGIVNVLIKKSLDEGFNCLVLLTLRQLTATAFLTPIAYLRERKSRPKITGWILLHIFFSALLGGSLAQYLFFVGLQYTSATFACAFLNMTPVFTFLVALPFRMEAVNFRSIAGKGKVVATIICFGGTLVLMFYKGTALTYISEAQATVSEHHASSPSGNKAIKWTIGSVALFAGVFSWSGWFLVQSKVIKYYPAIYSVTSIMFFFGSLQGAIMTFATQRDVSVWLLKGKLEILTILFSGVIGSGLGTLTMTWCVSKRGPVFTAVFSPLIQIVVAIADFSLLREPLYLGSVLGSLLVIAGLYVLLWSKNKEVQSNNIIKSIEDSDDGAGNRCNPQVEQV